MQLQDFHSKLCLFTDYVAGGELFTHLYQREHFHENEVRIYIAEIILALEQLHKVINVVYIEHDCNSYRIESMPS